MKREAQFLIPYAVDEDGQLIRRQDASRDQRYACPKCGERIILRAGDIRVKHFAHLGEIPCASETILHATAKRLIVEVIHAWKSGMGPALQVVRKCIDCDVSHFQHVPEKVLSAKSEYRLPSGRVADVALLGANGPMAAIEIYVRHLVPQEKAGSLEVPWVELNGDEVVADPLLWKPRNDRFKPYTCEDCNFQRTQHAKALERISRTLRIPLPWGVYHAEPANCYRCKQEMLVFTWPDHTMWTVRHPPEPIPPTLTFAYTQTTGGRYWANICPHCHAVQGDWNLYMEPDGHFFGHKQR